MRLQNYRFYTVLTDTTEQGSLARVFKPSTTKDNLDISEELNLKPLYFVSEDRAGVLARTRIDQYIEDHKGVE